MQLKDLNQEQLIQLKQRYLMIVNQTTSWDELYHADELVSYEQLESLWGETVFVMDDFGYSDERMCYSY